jgi:hypothetical protein
VEKGGKEKETKKENKKKKDTQDRLRSEGLS